MRRGMRLGMRQDMRQDTRHERRGMDMNKERGLLDFWRRMKFMLAAVT